MAAGSELEVIDYSVESPDSDVAARAARAARYRVINFETALTLVATAQSAARQMLLIATDNRSLPKHQFEIKILKCNMKTNNNVSIN